MKKIKADLVRNDIINALVVNNVKLHPSIIEELGTKFRFHQRTKGHLFDIYNAFTDAALKAVYSCFVKNEYDRGGRFLEYRFAQWLVGKERQIHKIDFDKKMSFGEIDVLGYDEDKKIICMAECKARKDKASKEHIDPWLNNVKTIYEKYGESLKTAYFVNVAGFTDGIKKRMLESVSESGGLSVGGLSARISCGGLWIGKQIVNIRLCEERAGKIKQIFP